MAIKTMHLVCDGCGAECFTEGRKLPKGWYGFRWVEGLVQKPGSPKAGRYEVCSPACLDKLGIPRQD
jgi:hypothetical protein